jgi:hypothetical protein
MHEKKYISTTNTNQLKLLRELSPVYTEKPTKHRHSLLVNVEFLRVTAGGMRCVRKVRIHHMKADREIFLYLLWQHCHRP